MPMFATTGCQSQQEKYNSMLSNAKIKNIESYSRLGYVSKSISTNKKNGRKNAWGSYSHKQTSKSYLAGLVGERVTGLNLSNGSSFWDIPISTYCDLGDFIGFTPEGFGAQNDGYDINNVKSCGFVNELVYILSKKTGKIYCMKRDDQGISAIPFIYGSKVLYTKYNSYWATVTEENEQLVITKSNMLQYLGEKLSGTSYGYDENGMFFDKHGNILIDGKIYGYDQKALEPNIKTDMPYGYEPFTNTFYTYCDDSFYVLEGLEFKKYDNVIFGYSFGEDPKYFYYTDKQGKYKVGYEEGHSWEGGRLLYHGFGVDLLSMPGKKVFQNYYWISNDFGMQYQECGSTGGFNIGSGLYEKLDSYTYLPIGRDNDYLYRSDSIWRDQYVYYLKNKDEYPSSSSQSSYYDGGSSTPDIEVSDHYEGSDWNVEGSTFEASLYGNNKFMKYDVIEDVETEIDTKGYEIRALSEDEYGNIVLSGFDHSSFKEFTGYLNDNDEVVFEPTKTREGEYDVIYMNPIN